MNMKYIPRHTPVCIHFTDQVYILKLKANDNQITSYHNYSV